jgi:hypothetical protein
MSKRHQKKNTSAPRSVRTTAYTLGATQRSFSSFAALRLKAASLQPFIPSHVCACASRHC